MLQCGERKANTHAGKTNKQITKSKAPTEISMTTEFIQRNFLTHGKG